MPRGRQLAPLILDEETREQLLGLAKSTTLPHSVVLRAKMILASAEGRTNTEAGRRLATSGGQVAPALPRERSERIARRTPAGAAAHLRRRQGRRPDQPRATGQAARRHALERPHAGPGRGRVPGR